MWPTFVYQKIRSTNLKSSPSFSLAVDSTTNDDDSDGDHEDK